MSSDGSGIAKVSGYTLFVPQTLPGDEVEILVLKSGSSYGYAKAERIIKPSAHRVVPPCPHFSKCGGCQLMMCDYEYQKEIKKSFVHDALLRIGNIDADIDFVGAENPFRYRNKMIFPFSEKGEWGFYRNRSHDVIPLTDCLLGSLQNKRIMNTVSEYIKTCHIPVYDEKIHSGIIRRVFIRSAEEGILVVISANSDSLPQSDRLIDALLSVSDNILGIILNVNMKRTNLVLGDKNILLWGKNTLSQELCGLTFDISPESFFQVNTVQTEKLYSLALDFAEISPKDTVLDLYCGIGTITLAAARSAKTAIGIESVERAIENARENAVGNCILNAEFYCSKAEDLVPSLIEKGLSPDIVILDPPRKGSDEKTLSAIISASPKRIVYVSCNPATLARDLKFLTASGYSLEKVTSVDMFPQTVHVETVCLLSREKNKQICQKSISITRYFR